MDPLLVISPHLDDAILSCGKFIASYPGVWVATPFAGSPDVDVTTSFDRNCGFAGSGHAMHARREEDRRACQRLGAVPIHGPLLDGQYLPEGGDHPGRHESVVEYLRQIISRAVMDGARTILAPADAAHEDHNEVMHAMWRIQEEGSIPPGREVIWYECLPNRLDHPPEMTPRWKPAVLGGDDTAAKLEALQCYRSQAWAIDFEVVSRVGERFWS